jgi:hypothetical protein
MATTKHVISDHDVGNEFAIRHYEAGKVMPDEATIDYQFARMYAWLLRVHPALC